VLLFIADDGHPAPEALALVLQAFPKPLIGGLFPELVVHSQRQTTGMLLVPLPYALQTAVFALHSNQPGDFVTQLQTTFAERRAEPQAMFIFMDAFGQNKNNFIQSLFNVFGVTVSYVGGGAGSLSFNPTPCIFHNTGIYQNAVVVGIGESALSLGVAHGWETISAPLKVTEANGNQIISLDWEPALDVYQRVVSQHSGQIFTEGNFFEIAKSYPLGIFAFDREMVVRDPFLVKGTTIYTLDDVPEGEYMSILHGDLDALLRGASSARQQADSRQRATAECQCFCVDCISRVLYMQDDFQREISTIRGDNQIDGILSLGEIANPGDSFLEIYNKTIVVAQWKTKA
jgi:hypothetical protein